MRADTNTEGKAKFRVAGTHGSGGGHVPPGDGHWDGPEVVQNQIDPQSEALPQPRGQGSPGDPQLGEGAQAKDQQGI